MIARMLLTLLAFGSTAAMAQTTDPTAFASGADVTAQVAAMAKAMKPGQGFAWHPLVRDGETIAALEYWKAPGRPAVHPDQAEYAIVIAGAGTLISGGTLDAAKPVKPDLTEGDRIIGGTTRTLKPGDVMLIPAGVPHWFGITGGKLVLLGTKLPVRR
ncbi:cupin [Sphingomonas sp. BK036]|jgi:mannose-6-phosphate isomerase-like protein (cupin superfamily)|uniref:cupin domain-containing protein n=1 Tax=Sphingomonas sp. BK036 TaxID=2512122 RepID=UPI0010D1F11E|nr:cupin domain-containing protein [Sphingomonas sp. BK036]RZT56252.1 cupin [Sphingomonas sp. BK036]